MFVHRNSDDKDQFDKVMSAVKNAPELVELGRDGKGNERFTSRSMTRAWWSIDVLMSAMCSMSRRATSSRRA
jgi:hypothetical protein